MPDPHNPTMPDPHNPVEILPGVQHYETSGFATTREAYDALTAEDGWTELKGGDTTRKRGTINGRVVVVHVPIKPHDNVF